MGVSAGIHKLESAIGLQLFRLLIMQTAVGSRTGLSSSQEVVDIEIKEAAEALTLITTNTGEGSVVGEGSEDVGVIEGWEKVLWDHCKVSWDHCSIETAQNLSRELGENDPLGRTQDLWKAQQLMRIRMLEKMDKVMAKHDEAMETMKMLTEKNSALLELMCEQQSESLQHQEPDQIRGMVRYEVDALLRTTHLQADDINRLKQQVREGEDKNKKLMDKMAAQLDSVAYNDELQQLELQNEKNKQAKEEEKQQKEKARHSEEVQDLKEQMKRMRDTIQSKLCSIFELEAGLEARDKDIKVLEEKVRRKEKTIREMEDIMFECNTKDQEFAELRAKRWQEGRSPNSTAPAIVNTIFMMMVLLYLGFLSVMVLLSYYRYELPQTENICMEKMGPGVICYLWNQLMAAQGMANKFLASTSKRFMQCLAPPFKTCPVFKNVHQWL